MINIDNWIRQHINSNTRIAIPIMTHPGIEMLGKKVRDAVTDGEVHAMAIEKLNEIYPITGYKLYYLFDFGDSWLFEIKKSRKKIVEEKNKKYPIIVESTGVDPEQYPDYEE